MYVFRYKIQTAMTLVQVILYFLIFQQLGLRGCVLVYQEIQKLEPSLCIQEVQEK